MRIPCWYYISAESPWQVYVAVETCDHKGFHKIVNNTVICYSKHAWMFVEALKHCDHFSIPINFYVTYKVHVNLKLKTITFLFCFVFFFSFLFTKDDNMLPENYDWFWWGKSQTPVNVLQIYSKFKWSESYMLTVFGKNHFLKTKIALILDETLLKS